MHEIPENFLPTKKVWERYGVTDRTIDRWLNDPAMDFPRPLKINGRRYFNELQLIAWERRRAGRAA
jgi:predicted DNA-binding transcriptional regulator AlpA